MLLGAFLAGAWLILAASSLVAVGIPLGILIGGLSGALSVQFLRTLQGVKRQVGSVLALVTQFAGIPTLWFAVPFGSKALAGIDPSRLLTSYIITVALIWSALVSFPLIQLVIVTVGEIKKNDD